jgi:hypothetical protein
MPFTTFEVLWILSFGDWLAVILTTGPACFRFIVSKTIGTARNGDSRSDRSIPMRSHISRRCNRIRDLIQSDPFLRSFKNSTREINNKLINVTESITRGASFSGSGQLLIPYEVVEGNIKDGAVVVEYADPPEACVNMEFKFAFRIMFERGLISDTEDFAVGVFSTKSSMLSR